MYRISYNRQVNAVRLAKQTLLPYPQVADEENQDLGTLNNLLNLLQVMGYEQIVQCSFLFPTLPWAEGHSDLCGEWSPGRFLHFSA